MGECEFFDNSVGNVGNCEKLRVDSEEWREQARKFIMATASDILEALKVDFIVKHGDGATQEVGEGVLVEFSEDNGSVFYCSTNRPEILFFAIVELFCQVKNMGLMGEFKEFLAAGCEVFTEAESAGVFCGADYSTEDSKTAYWMGGIEAEICKANAGEVEG